MTRTTAKPRALPVKNSEQEGMRIEMLEISLSQTPLVCAALRQEAGIAFEVGAQLQIRPLQGQELLYSRDLSEALPVAWLPRGGYRLQCHLHDLDLPPGDRAGTISGPCRPV